MAAVPWACATHSQPSAIPGAPWHHQYEGERAADIANVLVALFRRRPHEPWRYPPDEPPAAADGLMLGTAGLLHFLLRYRYPAVITSPPLLT